MGECFFENGKLNSIVRVESITMQKGVAHNYLRM